MASSRAFVKSPARTLIGKQFELSEV